MSSKKKEEILATGVSVESTQNSILPIDPKKAFEGYSEEEQKEILDLSNQIDVTKYENVMAYGSSVFMKSFEQCRKFLKGTKRYRGRPENNT